MRSVVRQMSDDDSEQGRIREGYGRLVQLMAKELGSAGARVALKTRVSALRWEPSSVVAVADDNEWRAKVALVALPLSVLKVGAAGGGVSIEPEPTAVRRGLDALEMGQALRVVLRLARPMGLLETLPSGAFLHGIDAEFPTLWLGPNRHEAQVTTWCGGPRATRLGERDARSIVLAAMRSVALGLDVSADTLSEGLLDGHVHSFGSDPFSLGAYPYAVAGGDASGAFDPVQSTLFFAGDYTVPEELGTVGIAVKSGVSAAREILDVFGR
jgi:monoamine oxidase